MQNKPLTKEEIKKYQLEMLSYLDEVCKKNNFPYSLAYGTLIGAVRHKGYIPWDDDIDIALDYVDYVKLIEIVNKQGKYHIYSSTNTKNFPYWWSKIIHTKTSALPTGNGYKEFAENGVFIDIFPLFNLESNHITKFYKKFFKYEKLSYVAFEKGLFAFSKNIGVFKSILRIPFVLYCKLLGHKYFINKMHKVIEKNFNSKGELFFFFNNGNYYCLTKDQFKNVIHVPFENLTVSIIKDYDKFLTKVYGDYMLLPSEDKRVPAHPLERFISKD